MLAATDGILLGENLSERPVYQEGIKGKFIGDVHNAVLLAKLLPNPTGEPLQFVDISFPLKDSKGHIQGVLAAHLSWEWAKEVEESVLAPLKREEKDIEFFIVSKKNIPSCWGPRNGLVNHSFCLVSQRLSATKAAGPLKSGLMVRNM